MVEEREARFKHANITMADIIKMAQASAKSKGSKFNPKKMVVLEKNPQSSAPPLPHEMFIRFKDGTVKQIWKVKKRYYIFRDGRVAKKDTEGSKWDFCIPLPDSI